MDQTDELSCTRGAVVVSRSSHRLDIDVAAEYIAGIVVGLDACQTSEFFGPIRGSESGVIVLSQAVDVGSGALRSRLQRIPEFPDPSAVGGEQGLFGSHGDDENGIAGRAFPSESRVVFADVGVRAVEPLDEG